MLAKHIKSHTRSDDLALLELHPLSLALMNQYHSMMLSEAI